MKCFSIDLDGTLLNSKHQVSKENVEAIYELKARGHEVILNTGRAYSDVVKIEDLQKLELPIFCINGAVLYTKDRELLYETTLPASTYQEVFTALNTLDVGILVYTNYGGFPSTLPPLHQKTEEELNQLFLETDYTELLAKDDLKVYKLIALVHPSQVHKIESVKMVLKGVMGLSTASSFPNNVEITSDEAHKGKALLRYQQLMNLSFEEIIAFGDGGNDLGQFEVATTSVAMANAPISIQAAADIVTKSNDENGFAYAVNQLLKNDPKPILI